MNTELVQKIVIEAAGPRNGRPRPPKMVECIEDYLVRTSTLLHPDQKRLLIAVCEDIDQQTDGEYAWSILFEFDPRAKELAGRQPYLFEAIAATTENIRGATLAYIDTKGSNNPTDWAQGTGILVAIEDRYFFATVAHALPKTFNDRLAVVARVPQALECSFPTILSSGRSDREDVGYFEVASSFVETLKGTTPLPLDRIHPAATGSSECWTILCGYPGAFTGKDDHTILYGSMCWTLQGVLEPQDWSRYLSTCFNNPDVDVDLFVPYDRQIKVHASNSSFPRLPVPNGLSGGGLWQPASQLAGGEIWQPSRYSLIGIQKSWVESGRYVRATQIVWWLRLLWKDHPSLQRTLAAAFPKITW